MTLTDVLLDFSVVSVLLLVGTVFRRKLAFFQRYYIPASLIAGALGILLGPQVLGQFSPVYLHYSAGLSQWSGVLTAIIFSASFLGVKLSKVSESALQTYFLAGAIHQIQVLVGLSLAFLLGLFFTDLQFGFGIFPVLAYYGGYGMAIAGGTQFEQAGYMADGTAVGATFATLGMITGVVLGMAVINRAAQKGITKVKMKHEEMPKSMLTGYFEPEERVSIGNAVTASAVIDPLGLQLALVGGIVLSGYWLRVLLIKIHPFWNNLPLFACCLIFGGVFCILTQKNRTVNDLIDRRTVNRISGVALDYLIASSIANTSLKVFSTYGVPLIITCAIITIVTCWACFPLGKKILPREDYFETAIGLFGMAFGVLATGLMLLKVIDPDYQTNGATNITSSSTLGYTFQLQYTLIFVAMLMTNPTFVYIWSWILLIPLLGFGLYFGKKIHAREDMAMQQTSQS